MLVAGTSVHAEALRDEVAAVLAPMGLRLSDEKTRVAHIDEGFDFLGFRIQRRTKRGTHKRVVYTYPSKRSLGTAIDKVRALIDHLERCRPGSELRFIDTVCQPTKNRQTALHKLCAALYSSVQPCTALYKLGTVL